MIRPGAFPFAFFFASLLAFWVAIGCDLPSNDGTDAGSGDSGSGGSSGTGGNSASGGSSATGGSSASTGGSSGTSSGLDSSLTLATLTTEQASTLCDWTNMKQGGYGRIVACPNMAESTNTSNLACVNGTLALGNRCSDLTVGNIEDCANATGTDLCKLETATECTTVATCGQ